MTLLEKYQSNLSTISHTRLSERIQEIVRGYRHSWDIYSELIQNAVDAINSRFRALNDSTYWLHEKVRQDPISPVLEPNPDYTGRISIEVDVATKRITISDNGLGITPDTLDLFLLPDESGKRLGHEYGYKGYGLTFVAFISRSIQIKSRYFLSNTVNIIEYDGLFDWMVEPKPKFPDGPIPDTQELQVGTLSSDISTVISVRLDDDYITRFPAISAADQAIVSIESPGLWERFDYILRTRTAIGNLNPLFNKPPIVPIEIDLMIRFVDGSTKKGSIPYDFFHPSQHAEFRDQTYEFADFIQNVLPKASRSGQFFRGLLYCEVDRTIGQRRSITCDVLIYAASSTRLGHVASALKLDYSEIGDVGLEYGVYLAIDGMPTGIRIDDWDNRGHDRRRYYCLVNAKLDISGQLDPGRKGISGHYSRLICDDIWSLITSKTIGNSDPFSRYAVKNLDVGRTQQNLLPSREFPEQVTLAQQDGAAAKRRVPDSHRRVSDNTMFSYIPREEAETVALFIDLRAQGRIKGYGILFLSRSGTYDAGMTYDIEVSEDSQAPGDPIGLGSRIVEEIRGSGKDRLTHAEVLAGSKQCLCVEFKHTIGDFIDDVGVRGVSSSKRPDDIDLLIVWSSEVQSSIDDAIWTLTALSDNERVLHGTTHRLDLPNFPASVPCIVLEKLLELVF